MPIAQPQTDIQPLLLRTREVATLLGVSESLILIWSRPGPGQLLHPIQIPGIGATRFRREEAERLAAKWCEGCRLVTASELAARLDAKTSGDGWEARCPAHEDHRRSMSITAGEDGRVLLHCHAGCETPAIVAALGLTMRDLFPPRTRTTTKRIVKIYDYIDAAGVLHDQVVRYDPKDFRQRRPKGNSQWIWNLKGIDRILYRLPTLRDQPLVFLVEGERDADRLQELGVPATTNAGGAGKWIEAYTRQLQIAGQRHDLNRSKASADEVLIQPLN